MELSVNKTSIPEFVSSGVPRLSHPVQSIQLDNGKTESILKNFATTNIFGTHMTLHNELEKQMYSQFKRLPTLPSSMVALETCLGLDEDFDFEDYLNDPITSETPLPPLHSMMEQRLGLSLNKSII
ncbi:proteasome maturation factor UMP1 family protein [Tieghemostelium lacteum]|uniref:Proteasome maturation factor UMP1 family protein n=1 Tax=Tieghemostelium lacteum TaxID=361077 RepID=A0A152A7R3_TIELA|nr:proteasome maturation factor UMP1 family protein [Tieghemostelium lacteum]|eukprot:KYR02171.1 proteasome maturation factor UMP1 family protein [Tieghemostelium lacteum]